MHTENANTLQHAALCARATTIGKDIIHSGRYDEVDVSNMLVEECKRFLDLMLELVLVVRQLLLGVD
jgi:hypothetical protein